MPPPPYGFGMPPLTLRCEAASSGRRPLTPAFVGTPRRLLAALLLVSATATVTVSAADALPDWALGPFARPKEAQPVIRPNPAVFFDCPMRHQAVPWEARHTFNPAAVVRNGRIQLLYRAEDDRGANKIGSYTSRIGLAASPDGFQFTPEAKPVLFPAEDNQKEYEWTGGCEDPRLAEGPDGTYVVTYTQYSGFEPVGRFKAWRIGLATSKDLRTWTKHGSPFEGTPFAETKIKSASIISRLVDGRLIATRIAGKYWMYFGELSVNIARSDDLVHWTPVTGPAGKLKDVMETRRGFFDAQLVEVGPPAVWTERGIVLIYNGKNGRKGLDGDAEIGDGAYSCGQALFDPADPARLITRLDKPFFRPELAWEKTGQYEAGTTFAEGLVHFRDRWFLYYGCADTFVGVASAPVRR